MKNFSSSNPRSEEMLAPKNEMDILSAKLRNLYESGAALTSPEMLKTADMHGGLAAKFMRLQLGSAPVYVSSCSLKC